MKSILNYLVVASDFTLLPNKAMKVETVWKISLVNTI